MPKTKDVAILIRGVAVGTPDDNFVSLVRHAVKSRSRDVTAARSEDGESVTIHILGVSEAIPEDRFAYLVYHAVKKLSRDVTVAPKAKKAAAPKAKKAAAPKAKKEGVANAEPVSRFAPERSRR